MKSLPRSLEDPPPLAGAGTACPDGGIKAFSPSTPPPASASCSPAPIPDCDAAPRGGPGASASALMEDEEEEEGWECAAH